MPLNVLFKIPTSMIKIATYLNPMDLNPTNRIVSMVGLSIMVPGLFVYLGGSSRS